MKTTHTYSILEVTPKTYAEVRAHLEAAGYQHAFHRDDDDQELIDLHGIALKKNGEAQAETLEVASILSHRTKRGMVEVSLNGEKTQFDIAKAREVLAMLHAATEAAITDELLVTFLTTKIGLPFEAATAALVDFREMRQGSRETVFHQ